MIANLLKWFHGNQGEGNFRRRCVLIVENNESDCRAYQKIVERMGHQTLTAPNGKEGLNIARHTKLDLILSNCLLPILSGIDMCRQLKKNKKQKPSPSFLSRNTIHLRTFWIALNSRRRIFFPSPLVLNCCLPKFKWC